MVVGCLWVAVDYDLTPDMLRNPVAILTVKIKLATTIQSDQSGALTMDAESKANNHAHEQTCRRLLKMSQEEMDNNAVK